MEKKQLHLTILILTIAGVLFSGYLSGVKFFNEVCAFNESCPYVLGIPACYYGFVMFTALFVVALLLVFKKYKVELLRKYLLGISIAGMLFAGFLSVQELLACVSKECVYGLGLPTCAYGLVVYLIVFILSLRLKK
jgi:uncharacterized membrane protein